MPGTRRAALFGPLKDLKVRNAAKRFARVACLKERQAAMPGTRRAALLQVQRKSNVREGT
jgi:hypothetical protein